MCPAAQMVESSGSSSSQVGQRKRPHQQSLPAGEKMGKEDGAPLGGEQARGRRLWGLLRRGFRRAVEKMKNEEMMTLHLSHGLQHKCRIVLASPVRHVTHDLQRRAFIALDAANTLHLLTEDGCCRGSMEGPVPMMGILYASHVNQFVAWDTRGLHVLDSHFQLLSQVPSALPIRCGIYSKQLNRIVTAGDGNLTIWSFRYGFRSLQCRASVSIGLGPSDLFLHLVLDTDSTSEPQRCFASCATGVATFDISRGNLLAFRTKLHSREITDLAYCEAIGCVITASRDTTIKVWDKEWHIRIVFVGHTAPVIAVTIYPHRPLIFSASQDGTIRTWNLNTIDQVDQVHVSEPVESLDTHTNSHVFSISGCSLNLWKINQLYSLYTLLGSPARQLSCVDLRLLGDFPARVLCLCQNSTVQLLDAQSGAPVSVLSLDQYSPARAVAYCLPRETLFVLLQQGHVLRVNAATSPMRVKQCFSSSLWESRPCCVLLYSHMVEPDKAYATWLEVTQNQGYRRKWQKSTINMQDRNRFLPILGHKNGSLSVIDWFLGRAQYTVEAHNPERVTALAEYTTQMCVLSAGMDLTVKMWRLFPHVEECLLPLLSFSCASPAWHMCFLGDTLAVAFQDPETVTYSIVHYNLMEQTRSEHGPEEDAQDDITGLCCCPNLKLFASSSRDGSVKIWDHKNRLLRHLKLNTIPESLAFANHKGDLLVGLEQHLYLIPHTEYLPSYYQMQLLWAKFLEPLKDISLPISPSSFEALVQENSRRLRQELPAKKSESSMSGVFRVPLRESREVREAKLKLEGMAQLAERNRDLQLLQEGKISPAKKRPFTKQMREEAFEHYLGLFYKEQLSLEIPEEDPFDADEVLESLGRMDPLSALLEPSVSHMFLGGFTKPRTLELSSSAFAEISPSIRFTPSLAVPGMLQVKRKKVDVGAAPSSAGMQETPSPGRTEAPPAPLTQEAPESIRPLSARAGRPGYPLRRAPEEAPKPAERPVKPFETLVLVTPESPSSPSPSTRLKSEKSVLFRGLVSSQLSQESQKHLPSTSRSMSPQPSAIVKGFFPQRAPSPQRSRTLAGLTSESLQLPRISSGFIPNSVVAQQLHTLDLLETERLVKVIGPQVVSGSSSKASLMWTFDEEELPKEEQLPAALEGISKSWIMPAKEDAPSTKQSTPGIFLTQLDESQYPELPRTVPVFVLPFVDQEWFQNLFPEGIPPEMTSKVLLRKLQETLLTADYSTKTEVLGAIVYLEDQLEDRAKRWIQYTLFEVLNQEGNAPSLQEKSQKKFILATLRVLLHLDKDSLDLMVELMTCYLMAAPSARAVFKDMFKELGLQDPHNFFFKEMNSWMEHRARLLEEAASGKLFLDTGHKTTTLLTLERKRPEKSRKKARKIAGKGAKAVHKDEMDSEEERQGKPSLEDHQKPVRPIDAIQHFAEKQLERERRELKEAVLLRAESPRDTVLALPPLQKSRAILRLGETNAMLRTRVAERCCFPIVFPRYLMKGFVPFLKLPLPRITLQPFPSLPRRPAAPRTFAAMQQLVHKYFLPKFSYADSYP
ncbi:WD repeat-containing protein 97 isoform X2 [Crotalus tigris]|uniref:WD repeat-containing protein 97 isoform X2 n=1 Tax=Crotalus tigris TaxID=88082 RepID=UPI00192F11E2|nr:WD repeat-containing protein 97 isoform X2 [Crotalus tigris]